MDSDIEMKPVGECVWELPRTGKMRVPGRIYADEALMKLVRRDRSPEQVANVAHLPGIVKYSLAMPDIHWGYGFPIGGVAAFDVNEGIISPGGVGYDINCGVRLLSTQVMIDEIKDKLQPMLRDLFHAVPTGVGSSGAMPRPNSAEAKQLLEVGARWAVDRGYGSSAELPFIEDNGCMPGAEAAAVSDEAMRRGMTQVGTLGAGNHFVEIDRVDEIYDETMARKFGLEVGQLAIQLHTGSRGFGHQVCDDNLRRLVKAGAKYAIELPDRQLACAPLTSPEGQQYWAAMACAANFAWVNRQVINANIEKSLKRTLSMSRGTLGLRLIYDVCHNIAKLEEHEVDGEKRKLIVHRKGATRCLPAGHPLVPEAYREVGQPVLVPGDMGRYSFLCLGLPDAMEKTFGSTCHGAGRVASRKKMIKQMRGRNLRRELKDRGVLAMSKTKRGLAEEMPEAYKDVSNVVDTMERAGISKKLARLRPMGVTKG